MHAPIPGLHQAVVECFLGQLPTVEPDEFTQPLEGRIPYLYCDVKGLLTCGVGNLVDPVEAALRVTGWEIDGRPATAHEIRADWRTLEAEDTRRCAVWHPYRRAVEAAKELAKAAKSDPVLPPRPTSPLPLRELHHKFAAPYTRIRLSDAAIDALVFSKLASNVRHMVAKHFPALPSWPADAQLAICSMAWAVGPDFPIEFPNLKKAANSQNWTACVASCKIREEGNAGVVPRNAHNRHCFMNASFVQSLGMPVDVLHWPGDAPEWPAHATSSPDEITRVDVPHPGPRPEPLAEQFFVSDVVKREPGR